MLKELDFAQRFWVNYNDLTVLPNPGIIGYIIREIVLFYGRKIQVSETMCNIFYPEVIANLCHLDDFLCPISAKSSSAWQKRL